MVQADELNAIGTSVIAFSTVISVIATITYYFVEILGMRIPIIILMGIIYIVILGLFIRYVRKKIK